MRRKIGAQAVATILLLSVGGCGGGGDGGGNGGGSSSGGNGGGSSSGGNGGGTSSGGDGSGTFYSMPPRYAPTAYPSYATQRSISDLEGTWLVLMSGVFTTAQAPLVNGSNYEEDDQYYARALLRLRQDPANPGTYFIYTCGPGGARNDITTPSAGSISIPFYYFSTTTWSTYSMSITDAFTLSNPNVSRPLGYVGTDGEQMSFNLVFTVKRLSDNAFAQMSSVTNSRTPDVADNGCFYESEGNYVATENDRTQQNFRKSGTFHIGDGFPDSGLTDHGITYPAQFSSSDLSRYQQSYSRGDIVYSSSNHDSIDIVVNVSGNSSSYSVHAISGANPAVTDSAVLTISP